MYRNFLIAILIFGLLGVMSGCSNTTDSSSDDSSIAEEFDGFLPTNESAAFGDPSVAALGEDTVYNDLLTDWNLIRPYRKLPTGQVHFRQIMAPFYSAGLSDLNIRRTISNLVMTGNWLNGYQKRLFTMTVFLLMYIIHRQRPTI